jgi:hypothetical protein
LSCAWGGGLHRQGATDGGPHAPRGRRAVQPGAQPRAARRGRWGCPSAARARRAARDGGAAGAVASVLQKPRSSVAVCVCGVEGLRAAAVIAIGPRHTGDARSAARQGARSREGAGAPGAPQRRRSGAGRVRAASAGGFKARACTRWPLSYSCETGAAAHGATPGRSGCDDSSQAGDRWAAPQAAQPGRGRRRLHTDGCQVQESPTGAFFGRRPGSGLGSAGRGRRAGARRARAGGEEWPAARGRASGLVRICCGRGSLRRGAQAAPAPGRSGRGKCVGRRARGRARAVGAGAAAQGGAGDLWGGAQAGNGFDKTGSVQADGALRLVGAAGGKCSAPGPGRARGGTEAREGAPGGG